jgi:hypothetical protein
MVITLAEYSVLTLFIMITFCLHAAGLEYQIQNAVKHPFTLFC